MKYYHKIFYIFLTVLFSLNYGSARTVVFDDFNSGIAVNYFGGHNQKWVNSGSCSASYSYDENNIFGRTGYSVRLAYNISLADSYNGFTMEFNNHDISEYQYMSFWVKGAQGGEFFKILLTDQDEAWLKNLAASRFFINDFLDRGVTTEWQKVVIPLDGCVANEQITNMYQLTFVFENVQGLHNNSPLNSSIYIDDIVFGTWDPQCVRLDPNGDRGDYWPTWDGSTALNGQLAEMAGGGGSISTKFTNMDIFSYNAGSYMETVYPYCFLLNYNVNADWSGTWNKIGGGASGEVAIESDFTDYDYFSFCAKPRTTAENPKIIKVEIKHDISVCLDTSNPWTKAYYVNISSNWQKYRLDLSLLPCKTNINMYCFVFERAGVNGILANGGALDGALIIDNVQLEKVNYSPDRTVPTAPVQIKINNAVMADSLVLNSSNILEVTADSGSQDVSLEGMVFEYSLNNGVTWYRIGTDYDTADDQYSVPWITRSIKNSDFKIRVYALDASGNTSAPVYASGTIRHLTKEAEELIKPEQDVLTPNNDGINDTLLFSSLRTDYEIRIYDMNSRLIKKITTKNFWDGRDIDDRLVESGIYFYIVEKGEVRINGHIMVVR